MTFYSQREYATRNAHSEDLAQRYESARKDETLAFHFYISYRGTWAPSNTNLALKQLILSDDCLPTTFLPTLIVLLWFITVSASPLCCLIGLYLTVTCNSWHVIQELAWGLFRAHRYAARARQWKRVNDSITLPRLDCTSVVSISVALTKSYPFLGC